MVCQILIPPSNIFVHYTHLTHASAWGKLACDQPTTSNEQQNDP